MTSQIKNATTTFVMPRMHILNLSAWSSITTQHTHCYNPNIVITEHTLVPCYVSVWLYRGRELCNEKFKHSHKKEHKDFSCENQWSNNAGTHVQQIVQWYYTTANSHRATYSTGIHRFSSRCISETWKPSFWAG